MKTKKITTTVLTSDVNMLFAKLSKLIKQSQQNVALIVNAELTHLYWQMGQQIKTHIVKQKRAEYGEQILATLSQKLTIRYGRGFAVSALNRMMNFYSAFPDKKIVATLSQKLSWSHFIEFIAIKNQIQREFYIELCQHERWSVRDLREKISSMFFERTAISRKPEKLIKQELAAIKKSNFLTPDFVFRDPCFLDFLNLKDVYSEKDLESAIIIDLQKFISEFGSDFAFLSRQKRIIIDGEDYFIDLLFFHRGLKRLVAIDLKLGKFKPSYKSQMELYLKWLEKHEMKNGEELPIGLILCADKSDEHIELLQLQNGNIRVAQYLTALPSKKLLKEKLHKAVERGRNNYEDKGRNKKVVDK